MTDIKHYYYGGPRSGDEVEPYLTTQGTRIDVPYPLPLTLQIKALPEVLPEPPCIATYRRAPDMRIGDVVRVFWVMEGCFKDTLGALVHMVDHAMGYERAFRSSRRTL